MAKIQKAEKMAPRLSEDFTVHLLEKSRCTITEHGLQEVKGVNWVRNSN